MPAQGGAQAEEGDEVEEEAMTLETATAAFGFGLSALPLAHEEFTSASGPAAEPHLQKCVDILNSLAYALEAAELDYSTTPGVVPSVNTRQDHIISELLQMYAEADDALYVATMGLFQLQTEKACTAAARALLALAPLPSDKSQHVVLQILAEDTAFEKVLAWVREATGAKLVYATGLLSVMVQDRELADYVVRTDIASLLLQRLKDPRLSTQAAARAAEQDAAAGNNGELPVGVTRQDLVKREVEYCYGCLAALGEYQEILGPFFQEGGMEVVMAGIDQWVEQAVPIRLAALECVARLLAHKKVSMAFVQSDGVNKLLRLSQDPEATRLHGVLALCLFGIASLSNCMELVCRLPASQFEGLLSYATSLLRCPQEPTQKHVVLFFSLALAFRPVLSSFDRTHDGLYCLLNLLRSAPGPSAASASSAAASLSSNLQRRGQLAHYTCLCLRHYLRVHLALATQGPDALVDGHGGPPSPSTATTVEPSAGFKRPRSGSADGLAAMVPPSYFRPVEVDDAAAEGLLNHLKGGQASLPRDWLPAQRLLHHRGILTLLSLVASASAGRAGAETARFALECLEILTLVPSTLRECCLVEMADERTGIQVLLEAASGSLQRDADVMRGALRVLCNCLLGHRQGPTAILPPLTTEASSRPATGQGKGGRAGRSSVSPAPGTDQEQQEGGEEVVVEEAVLEEERSRKAIRSAIRAKNGIKMLVSLLRYRRCIHAADEVRMLSARALLGLSQDAAIAQILEKMRVSQLLTEVVRAGPVLEKASDPQYFSTLKAQATQLIARITGRPTSAVSHSDAMDPASWKLEKAAIVARTSITYDPLDLLQLIRDHLHSQGLTQAARALEREAHLPPAMAPLTMATTPSLASAAKPSAMPPLPLHPHSAPTPVKEAASSSSASSRMPPPAPAADPSGGGGAAAAAPALPATPAAAPPFSPPPAPSSSSSSSSAARSAKRLKTSSSSGGPPNHGPPSTPMVDRSSSSSFLSPPPRTSSSAKLPAPSTAVKAPPAAAAAPSTAADGGAPASAPRLSRPTSGLRSGRRSSLSLSLPLCSPHHPPHHKPTLLSSMPATTTSLFSAPPAPTPALTLLDMSPAPALLAPRPASSLLLPPGPTTLDHLVTSYLRHQHEQCPDPVCVLPPFSLTLPHRCPDHTPQGASTNVARRLLQRQLLPPHGGWKGSKAMRALIFGRLRPWRSYRDEAGQLITTTAFPHGPPGFLWAGTTSGTVHRFNLWSAELEESWDLHGLRITSMTTSPEHALRPMLLTSASEMEYGELHAESAVWLASDLDTPLVRLDGLRAAVFDKAGTRLAGVRNDNGVRIIDVEIGTLIREWAPQDGATPVATSGTRGVNVAFSPMDGQLVLSDGFLWDVRGRGLLVHRFDKLSNGAGNHGVFHPNGNDVVMDSSVWDLRTFSLRCMTGVDQCVMRFSAKGDVMYAFRPPFLSGDDPETGGVRPNSKRARDVNCIHILDASDYKAIQVHESERQVVDVAVDSLDYFLSVVESGPTPLAMVHEASDAICRLYEVGRKRPNDADSDIDDAHSDSEDDDDDWNGEEDESDDMDLDLADLEDAEDDFDEEDEEEDEGAEGAEEGGSTQGSAQQVPVGEDGQPAASGGEEEAGGSSGDDESDGSHDDEEDGEGSDEEDDDDDDEDAMNRQRLFLLGELVSDDDEEDDEEYVADGGEDDDDDDDEDEWA